MWNSLSWGFTWNSFGIYAEAHPITRKNPPLIDEEFKLKRLLSDEG